MENNTVGSNISHLRFFHASISIHIIYFPTLNLPHIHRLDDDVDGWLITLCRRGLSTLPRWRRATDKMEIFQTTSCEFIISKRLMPMKNSCYKNVLMVQTSSWWVNRKWTAQKSSIIYAIPPTPPMFVCLSASPAQHMTCHSSWLMQRTSRFLSSSYSRTHSRIAHVRH